MVEAYADVANQMRYFGTPERPGANFPFNFNIIGTNNQSTAQELKRNIDAWFDNIPEGAQSNWVVSNTKITTPIFKKRISLLIKFYTDR